MKRALIQPPNRVAQVEAQDFPVAPPLFWTDCPDDAKPETHFYNGTTVVPNPSPPPPAAGAKVSLARERTEKVEELERRMSRGAPQGEINAAILDLLRE